MDRYLVAGGICLSKISFATTIGYNNNIFNAERTAEERPRSTVLMVF